MIEDARNLGANQDSGEFKRCLKDSSKYVEDTTICLTAEYNEKKIIQKLKSSDNHLQTILVDEKIIDVQKNLRDIIEKPAWSIVNEEVLIKVKTIIKEKNLTSKNEIEDRTYKRILSRLTVHLQELKSIRETDTSVAYSLLESIASSLSHFEKTMNKLSSIWPQEDDLTKVLEGTRKQLTKDLDKLQDAFTSNVLFSSGNLAAGRIVAENTTSGFLSVVTTALVGEKNSAEIRKILQDCQQLMKWTLDVLVHGGHSEDEDKPEIIDKADKVLEVMKAIVMNLKSHNKDIRTLDDSKIIITKILQELSQTENAYNALILKKHAGTCEEEVIENMSNSRDSVLDILFSVKEAVAEGVTDEVIDQVKYLTDAMKDFNEGTRAFLSLPENESIAAHVKEDTKKLMGQASDLIDQVKGFDQPYSSRQQQAESQCESIEDSINDIVNPIVEAYEHNTISNILKDQDNKIKDQSGKLKEEPTLGNLGIFSVEVNKMVQCLDILAKRELQPAIQVR